MQASEKEALKKRIRSNKHEIFIFSLEEMDHVMQKSAKSHIQKDRWNKHKQKIETTSNYFASGKDAVLLSKLLADMGYASARAYIKVYGGKPHIILKGFPGARKILNATRYGAQNAKVVKMGLGKYGAINAAKSGGILTIILLSTYRVIDYFVRDEATLAQLVGTLATDIVKVGITTGVALYAATGTAVMGTALTASTSATIAAAGGFIVAIGPLAAVVIVGVGLTYLLTVADEEYQITEKVIAAIEEISEKGIRGIIAEKKQAVIRKSGEIADDMVESVIDYAVERVQEVIIKSIRNIFRRMTTPSV